MRVGSWLLLLLLVSPAAASSVDDVVGATVLRSIAWSAADGTERHGIWGDARVLSVEGYNADGHLDLIPCERDNRFVVGPANIEASSNDPILTASGHGAWVAGSLCGAGAAYPGHHGVAPGAMVLSWNHFLAGSQEDEQAYHDEHAIRLMTHSTATSPLQVWSPLANGADMTVFWAAGNAGGDGRSATTFANEDARVLLVAASTWDGSAVASYSSRGAKEDPSTWPDVTAPGCRFVPHPLTDQWVRQRHEDPISPAVPAPGDCPDMDPAASAADYVLVWGTSFAAPTVAGVAALMLEVHPDLPAADLRAILKATARPFLATDDVDGDGRVTASEFRLQHGWQAGWGMVDAGRAVATALALREGMSFDTAVDCAAAGATGFVLACPTPLRPAPPPMTPTRNATGDQIEQDLDRESAPDKQSPMPVAGLLVGIAAVARRNRG